MIDPDQYGYDLEKEFVYTLVCPICGEVMYPIPGGFECDECGHAEYLIMWILERDGVRYTMPGAPFRQTRPC